MNALNNNSQTESSVTSVRAVRWIWVHGGFGWNGVLLLVATVAIFGFVDYRLLRSMSEEERCELSATYRIRQKIKMALIDQQSKRVKAFYGRS
jgi:hypothetical protein